VAEIVREEFPGAFLSVSSEVLPQYREYERFSTVCLNAYVGPTVASYVRRLEDELRSMGVRTGVHLMTSASGVATAEGAVQRPVNLLMSGPVAGVVGGIWAGRQAGYDNVITLDVGGTSADIGLAQEGRLRMKHLLDTRVGPYQAMIPMVDVDTIGAGGGSIAYVDAGGIYRVGPRSAGADPGPAAYDRGGTEATATDAMVNLGWLSPEAFLGGGMELRADLARRAYEDGPASVLGMSVEEASMGAVQILTHSMVQSIEENSVRKGYDPRDFALVAEGGAGPLFAAQIALEVGTPWVLVPPYPGVTAAMGLLATDTVYEYGATVYQRRSTLDPVALQRVFEELEEQARVQLEADGVTPERIVVQRVCDCRYLGQGYELRVDAPAGPIDHDWVERLSADFHDIHEREYSRRFEQADIEIPNVRVRGIGLMPPLETVEVEHGDASPEAALRHEGKAWFRVGGELREVPARYYERSALRAGNRIEGPAIVNQYDTTTVIPPGLAAHIDRYGNIVIAISSLGSEMARDEGKAVAT
jgi:5-oxoprolinase (ATP-hydrolysing)/N-methylhydantoinase A